MRRCVFWLLVALGLGWTHPAKAYDRFTNGRRLFRRRCGVCLSMGWVWQGKLPKGNLDLAKMAADWSPARVCTWLHRQTKKIEPPGCYPGRIRYRERLAILYYLWRRAQGPIRKPKLGPIYYVRAPVSLRLKPVTPGRRKKLRLRLRNRREVRRWQRWYRRLRPSRGRPTRTDRDAVESRGRREKP